MRGERVISGGVLADGDEILVGLVPLRLRITVAAGATKTAAER